MIRKLMMMLCLLPLWTVQAQETEYLYLSGTGMNDTRTWDFRCSDGMRAGRWGKIEVPSCWELQGYGAYTYGRYYLDKTARPADEVGEYRTSFRLPRGWEKKRVSIVFEGSMTDTEVKINGQSAGDVHQGGFCRFEYDITALLKPGRNKLEVRVSKESANASVNEAERKADWWLFGGIYRPVYLKALPQAHISQVATDPRMDGTLSARLQLAGVEQGSRLQLEVAEAPSLMNGGTPTTPPQRQEVALQHGETQTIETTWKDIKPWDPEHPHLYNLTLTLLSPEGRVLHRLTERIGFRTVEFRRHDGIYLNDVRLVAKGTNRHSFHPESGRTTSKALSVEDALLIKEMNMNAVRSHYPPDTHFLDVCDSLGLLYIDELAGWQTRYDDTTAVCQLKEMIARDANHPCIYLWSNGNEGGWNTSVDHLFAEWDIQKRHVIHPWADFDGLDTNHYPAYQTGPYRFTNGDNVFMPTEFLHGLYDRGHGAGLDDFWESYTRSPLFAGGYLWAYVDEAVRRTDKGGILDSDGRNGPDGIVGAYREKEGSFFTVREVWSPIRMERLHVTPSFSGKVMVENAFLYTNLKDCRMTYATFRTPSPLSGKTPLKDEPVHQGEVSLPAINPGERAQATFRLPDDFFECDLLQLTAVDHLGREVCTWSAPIKRSAAYIDEQLAISIAAEGEGSASAGQASLEQATGSVRLSAAGVEATFDTHTGLLRKVTAAGREVAFNNGPRPVGMKAEFQECYTCKEGDDVLFVAKYKGGVDSIAWRMSPDGLLRMQAVLLNSPNGKRFRGSFVDEGGAKNLGLTFSYPEEQVSGLTWLGRGPYRVWKNRVKGTQFGIHCKSYNNTITGEYGESSDPIVYPEFKGYHADVRWAGIESDGMPFRFYTATEGLYLHLFTPREPLHIGAKDNTMEAWPDGDISFLLEIPAMRSYKTLPQMGPRSQPSNVRIKVGDEGFLIDVLFEFNV
ncbi:MAG: beta-galactosidase [Bacteroides sp.]|nr:beta-galactosidase [Bacteroides sp.]